MYFSLRFSLIVMACCLLGARSVEPATSPDRVGKDFALFFAVDTYQDTAWTDLNNPVRDAVAIAEELERQFGFETEMYRNVSKRKIREVLRAWQQKSFDKDAQLFVFFSGHGSFNELSNQGYFVPIEGKEDDSYNDSHFMLLEIGNMVTNIPCNHILLAIDACYSGTIDQEIAFKSGFKPRRLGENPLAEQNRNIAEQLSSKSRFLITSGGKERTPDGDKHSPFSQGILKALKFTYSQGDGLLSWIDLLGFIQDVQPRPHHGKLYGHEGGGFVFAYTELKHTGTTTNPSQAVYLEAVQCGTIACWKDFLDKYDDPNDPFVHAAQTQLHALLALQKNNLLDQIPLPEMVEIPGGSFIMGQSDPNIGGERRTEDEQPPHKVKISRFELSETEITNTQYCAFLNENGNPMEGGKNWLTVKSKGCLIEETAGQFTPKPGFELHPVIEVSWYGAHAYCKWLSTLSGEDYRLPTEAEWEYAAGGGPVNRTKFAGTNDEQDLRSYANFEGKGGLDTFRETAPVKSFYPNQLGLYDMSGNALEWCADFYDKDYYQYCLDNHIEQNPFNTNISIESTYRGGSWYNKEGKYLRVADRIKGYHHNSSIITGFRIAKTLP